MLSALHFVLRVVDLSLVAFSSLPMSPLDQDLVVGLCCVLGLQPLLFSTIAAVFHWHWKDHENHWHWRVHAKAAEPLPLPSTPVAASEELCCICLCGLVDDDTISTL